MPSVSIIGTRGYPSHYGGFETAVRKLAPHLADAGWDVAVYGRNTGPDEAAEADPRIRRIGIRAPKNKSFETLVRGLRASAHAAKEKPDVVLIMNVANGLYLPLFRLARIPSLVNVDGIEWERAKWGRLARAVFRVGSYLTARLADQLVVDAVAIGERWRRDIGRDGLFIPYGGDQNSSLPCENGLESRNYILMVARFVPENSVDDFFSAVPALSATWPIVVVGTSGFGDELDQKARALAEAGQITWLGHVSDEARLNALWEHAGLYFHGHSVGGTNPALVQAMASGAPVLARDTPYTREVLADTGAFYSGGPEQIVNTARAIMNDPQRRQAMSRLAMKRAQSHYSWDGVCAAYEAALRNLLKSKEPK